VSPPPPSPPPAPAPPPPDAQSPSPPTDDADDKVLPTGPSVPPSKIPLLLVVQLSHQTVFRNEFIGPSYSRLTRIAALKVDHYSFA